MAIIVTETDKERARRIHLGINVMNYALVDTEELLAKWRHEDETRGVEFAIQTLQAHKDE